jgi:serine/threonine-protein kinase HipA
MKKLSVFYEGWGERWLLGILADNGRELLFEYSPEALAQGLELSPRHLRLRAAAYGGFPDYLLRLPGLIADALPDGWGLLLMDRLFRKSGRPAASISPLDRLAFIHDRAMGALSFEPAQSEVLVAEDVDLLTLAGEARVIVADKDTVALRQLALLGGSPHGARPKVLVHYNRSSEVMSTTTSGDSEPWLVKFQAQGEHKEVCAIEAWYAELARAAGLAVPETKYFDLSKTLAGFGIARFDVEAAMRVPTHTLAGLLHADFRRPSCDYTSFLRATRLLSKDVREVEKAFERAVFNVLFHNRDDHSKNFSYRLGRDRQWRLAPAYDLTYNTGPGGEHQMDVCGEGRAVKRADLIRLAGEGELDAVWAGRCVDRLRDIASTAANSALQFPIRAITRNAILKDIAHCSRLLK